jgi:NADH:ubiquinone oxidoreductase subunit 5 (subunit L)/multisubunit Na+/H+ antiporter MnhA subunit
MPITFSTFLIASFAISGLPPFNGFASKWMVYQGILQTAKDGGYLWVIWLVCAMFGSALTLASFMKLIHAVFLGQTARKSQGAAGKVKEVGPLMWAPQAILAVLCVVFGVFAYRIPLRFFIAPSIGQAFSFSGIWGSGLASMLVIIAIGLGGLIYLLGTVRSARQTEVFMGGEILKDVPQMRVSGTEFYKTIKDMPVVSTLYALAERKVFDIYDLGVKATFGFNRLLSYLHNGVLPTYLAWCLLGMGIVFYLLFK